MDYPPLFESGFYDLPFDKLRESLWKYCVEPFENRRRREYLTEQFCTFCGELHKIGLTLEVWFDGSYVTEKPSPNDIDVVIFFRKSEYDSLSREQQKIFDRLDDYVVTKSKYDCDAYFVPSRPDNWDYWEDWFGHSRQKGQKGILRFYILKEFEDE